MALAIAVLLSAAGISARSSSCAVRDALARWRFARPPARAAARLLRQMLTETLVLFLLGAAAGLVVARVALAPLVGFFAIGRNAIELDAHIDWRAAAFAAGVALVAAVVTGVWPALRAIRVDPQHAMRSGDPRLGGAPVPGPRPACSSAVRSCCVCCSWCPRCSLPRR